MFMRARARGIGQHLVDRFTGFGERPETRHEAFVAMEAGLTEIEVLDGVAVFVEALEANRPRGPRRAVSGLEGFLDVWFVGLYMNPCATPNSSPSCDTLIVATVTIDANTPGGSVETLTVTANGLNSSGFLPVPIQGQSGQATAQATTQAFNAPIPQIMFNGSNIAGQTVTVYVGQRIPLTAVINLLSGASPTSQSWNRVVRPSGLSGAVVAATIHNRPAAPLRLSLSRRPEVPRP